MIDGNIKIAELPSKKVSIQSLKYLASGNIASMWFSYENVNSNMKTYLQIHDKYGTKLKGAITVPIEGNNPKLEPLSDGKFVIYTKDKFYIFNSEANLLDTIKLDYIHDNYSFKWDIKDDHYPTSITAMPDNKFLFTWHEHTKTYPGGQPLSIFKGIVN
ncbi:hypothetical protein NOVO_06835 [Rickettsiales bacterium Ac37b]|nr:hypothetical protein NOVO_06835 [Rickettsiales bacterium Ac37b]